MGASLSFALRSCRRLQFLVQVEKQPIEDMARSSKIVAVTLTSFAALASAHNSTVADALTLGPSTFTAPGTFPTSLYSSY